LDFVIQTLMDFKKDFNRLPQNGQICGSLIFLSETQIWVWWTRLKQRNRK